MMRQLIIGTFALLLAMPALADRRTNLEDAPPIRARVELRAKRHQVTPIFGFSMNDAYQRSLSAGITYRYYVNNWLGVGIDFVGTYFNFDTGLTEQIDAQLSAPGKSGKPSTSNPSIIPTVAVTFVPIYGKMMLFGTFPMAYDVQITLGAGYALTNGEGRIDDGGSFAPMWGVGTRFFFSDWIALEVGLRDYIIDMPIVAPSDVKDPEPSFTQNFMVTLGVSFFFPPEPETEL